MRLLPDGMLIGFGSGAATPPDLGPGWSFAEATHRWSIGPLSTITLPPVEVATSLYLCFDLWPHRGPAGTGQRVVVEVNGTEIDRFVAVRSGLYGLLVPAARLERARPNVLTLRHPDHARPAADSAPDPRDLALGVRSLRLDSWDFALDATPRRLAVHVPAPLDPAYLKRLSTAFESLGQDCELGLFQRWCGTEPLGLLRFATIGMVKLVEGLDTRFAGLEEPADLSFSIGADDEYVGHHRVYVLDYHTARAPGSVDLGAFRIAEARRLTFLAAHLMEQIEQGRRIFVHQRRGIERSEVLPLLRSLRRLQPEALLLWISEAPNAAMHNVVEREAPGLFHGFIDRLAAFRDTYNFSIPGWLVVCSQVFGSVRRDADGVFSDRT